MILGVVLHGSIDASAEIIERILAVVAGRVIMLSDVRAALDLGLVERAAGDPVTPALERLIQRELILGEVRRYVASEPSEADLTARMRAIQARLGNEEEYRAILAATGMTDERLQEFLRDDLRIAAYLEERFASAAQPTDDEVSEYYREHSGEFVKDGVQLSLAAVAESIRARLAGRQRQALIDTWVSDLRRRTDILILHLSSKP